MSPATVEYLLPSTPGKACCQITTLFAAFALLAGGNAAAADYGRAATWVAEPLPTAGAASEVDLNRVYALDTRLLPVRLASPVTDIQDNDGTVLVKKGTQLVWVPKMSGLKNDRDLYCTFRSLKNQSEPYWRYNTVSNKLICLFDYNEDQVMDGYQNCYSFYPAFLIDGKCRAQTVTIRPSGYSNISPKEFRSDLVVGLRIYGRGYVYECAGSKYSCDPITRRTKLDELPAKFSWLGSDIQFKRTSEDRGTLEVLPIITPREMSLHAPWVAFSIWL